MAEAVTLTAGTFMCAVLEQAGYMTHAQLLQNFRDFFREAGALLYIISAVGGIVSYVVFGSFRAVQYLLLGPALFWLMIGPTQPFAGVVWQIGDEQARDLEQNRGKQVSQEQVNEILQNSGRNAAGPYEVAYPFYFFVRLIDSITRELTQIMIQEGDKYQNAVTKGKAVDYLISYEPEEPLITKLTSLNLGVNCSEMFGAAFALSTYDLNKDVLKNKKISEDVIKARTDFHLNNYTVFKEDKRVTLREPNSDVLTAWILSSENIDNAQEAAKNGGSISCFTVWKYVAKYIEKSAINVKEEVIKIAQGGGVPREQACKDVLKKFTQGNDVDDCENKLENVVSLYILKNAITRQQPAARIANELENRRTSPAVRQQTQAPSLASGNITGTPDPLAQQGSNFSNAASPLIGQSNQESSPQTTDVNSAIDPYHGSNALYDVDKERWTTATRLVYSGGSTETAFSDLPRYNLKNLKQSIFSMSLNLPYWQGTILYILAISYPFLALIVLIPGRAVSFLTLPLAWLWVKSWDLGFATVYIFERILWNIFPSVNIANQFFTRKLSSFELFEPLSEVHKYDQLWNLHTYYMTLSMATLSVPTVMGYVVLKSRRALLSSFTDKLRADVSDSGNRAAAGMQLNLASSRVQAMKDLKTAAALSIGLNGGKGQEAGAMFGGDRGKEFSFFTAIGSAGGAAKTLGGMKASDLSLSGAGDKAYDAIKTGVDAVDNFGIPAWRARFNYDRMVNLTGVGTKSGEPGVYSRYGEISRLMDRVAAQYDLSGGFEITDSVDTSVREYIGLLSTKVSLSMDASGNLGRETVQAFLGRSGLDKKAALLPVIAMMKEGIDAYVSSGEIQMSDKEQAALKEMFDKLSGTIPGGDNIKETVNNLYKAKTPEELSAAFVQEVNSNPALARSLGGIIGSPEQFTSFMNNMYGFADRSHMTEAEKLERSKFYTQYTSSLGNENIFEVIFPHRVFNKDSQATRDEKSEASRIPATFLEFHLDKEKAATWHHMEEDSSLWGGRKK